MTPKFIHIGIEQYLQSIDSNIYSTFKKKEIDLQFNTVCDKYIDKIVSPNKRVTQADKIFEDYQFTLDDLRLLKKKSIINSTNNTITFPNDYRNLISDTSLIRREDCFTSVKSNGIKPDTYYINESTVSLSYNNIIINPNQIFVGLRGISTFTIGITDYKVIELNRVQNRLVESEYKEDLKRIPFTKAKWNSPISEIYGSNLVITTDNSFYVSAVEIAYIRVLNKLDSTNWEIDWNTEFPENIIRTLIDITGKRMLFLVESSRYNTASAES